QRPIHHRTSDRQASVGRQDLHSVRTKRRRCRANEETVALARRTKALKRFIVHATIVCRSCFGCPFLCSDDNSNGTKSGSRSCPAKRQRSSLFGRWPCFLPIY